MAIRYLKDKYSQVIYLFCCPLILPGYILCFKSVWGFNFGSGNFFLFRFKSEGFWGGLIYDPIPTSLSQ